jgi:hypothetical protein
MERIAAWTGRSGGFEDDLTLIVPACREATAP